MQEPLGLVLLFMVGAFSDEAVALWQARTQFYVLIYSIIEKFTPAPFYEKVFLWERLVAQSNPMLVQWNCQAHTVSSAGFEQTGRCL